MRNYFKGIGNLFGKDIVFFLKEQKSRSELNNFLPTYFPYSTFSILYSDLEMLLNHTIFNGSTTILETGSGLSTLVLGKYFKFIGHGKVISLENDKKWYDLMTNLITADELSDFVKIVYCPTIDIKHSNKKGKWYDEAVYQQEIAGVKFDGFILDGPRANSPALIDSRYPSYTLIEGYAKSNYFVFMDDYKRTGDKENFANIIAKFHLSIVKQNRHGKGVLLTK